MIVELFIFFEIIAIVIFISAFFAKHEILWSISTLLYGFLMVASYNIEYIVYKWNPDLQLYQAVLVPNSYSYIMLINLLFFMISVVLLIIDIFDKYGSKFMRKKPNVT